MNTEKLYGLGETVPQSGKYICIICDHVMEFQAGDKFVVCPVCRAGTENGPIAKDQPFWKAL